MGGRGGSRAWGSVPRGGSDGVLTVAAAEAAPDIIAAVNSPPAVAVAEAAAASASLRGMLLSAASGLAGSLEGIKSDSLILLLTTALVPAVCGAVKASPILGFLATGLLAGPNGMGWVSNSHGVESFADLGVVLFLFEMGIHLDLQTLMKMRVDVFGLGLSQFVLTALAIGGIAFKVAGMSGAASVVLGGGLALSSSAFVLQLLKDKDQLESEYGRTSFGVLLLQDLAVVPLLVAIPILAGGDKSVGEALASSFVQAVAALSTIALFGKFLLKPLFGFVSASGSQEAFLGLLLSTVLGMSFLTEGLGLSNTLGAFLAGVLLSETEYRHRVEKEISPFRGILVGLFFFTVGFEIDLQLMKSKSLLIAGIVIGIVAIKAAITAGLCMSFKKGLPVSQRAGLVLSQGGEFAFVAFRLAKKFGILDDESTRLLLTCVSLTMITTPFLEEMGGKIAKKLE